MIKMRQTESRKKTATKKREFHNIRKEEKQKGKKNIRQAAVLHDNIRVCPAAAAHAVPVPTAAVTTAYVWVMDPPPQLFEHNAPAALLLAQWPTQSTALEAVKCKTDDPELDEQKKSIRPTESKCKKEGWWKRKDRNKMKGFGMENKGKRNENERNTSAHGLHEMEGGRLWDNPIHSGCHVQQWWESTLRFFYVTWWPFCSMPIRC